MDSNGFYYQLKHKKCFILLMNFIWIDTGLVELCKKMWQPPKRKQLQNYQKIPYHLQKQIISEWIQLKRCELRHCIAFEKLFNLLMNFYWFGKRQHCSNIKRSKEKNCILGAITILTNEIYCKLNLFRLLKLVKSKINCLFTHTDSSKINPISILFI